MFLKYGFGDVAGQGDAAPAAVLGGSLGEAAGAGLRAPTPARSEFSALAGRPPVGGVAGAPLPSTSRRLPPARTGVDASFRRLTRPGPSGWNRGRS